MSEPPERHRAKIGIYFGHGAKSNFFGNVVIEGAEVGIEDHGADNTFDVTKMSGVDIGVVAHGSGLTVNDLTIAPDREELLRYADPVTLKAELKKSLPDDEVGMAMELSELLISRRPKSNILDRLEAHPAYRAARAFTVFQTLMTTVYGIATSG